MMVIDDLVLGMEAFWGGGGCKLQLQYVMATSVFLDGLYFMLLFKNFFYSPKNASKNSLVNWLMMLHNHC